MILYATSVYSLRFSFRFLKIVPCRKFHIATDVVPILLSCSQSGEVSAYSSFSKRYQGWRTIGQMLLAQSPFPLVPVNINVFAEELNRSCSTSWLCTRGSMFSNPCCNSTVGALLFTSIQYLKVSAIRRAVEILQKSWVFTVHFMRCNLLAAVLQLNSQ